MELGVYTFVETRLDPKTGEPVDLDKTFAELFDEIELADRVGLDVFGLGEHHRPDYAISAPAVALAAGAARTKRIRLTSAVTVLSSDDPVRVYQQFATLDCVSGGRAEIMAGRGAFIESFPLFGYDLEDYEKLFSENLELLLAIRKDARPNWRGGRRPPLDGQGVYPRALQNPLPVWIASGGTPQSVARAGASRRRSGKRAETRDQRPRLCRRHGRGRGRRLFRALRRGDAPPGPRARLAAPLSGAVRHRPLAARTSDARVAGRRSRQDSRAA